MLQATWLEPRISNVLAAPITATRTGQSARIPTSATMTEAGNANDAATPTAPIVMKTDAHAWMNGRAVGFIPVLQSRLA